MLQGGEALYLSLYALLEQAELQSEIGSCHYQLMEWLDKPEHKLLLKMVDDYDHLVDMQFMDSFLFGLKPSLNLTYGLKHYDGHLLDDAVDEDVRRFPYDEYLSHNFKYSCTALRRI